MDNIEVKPEVVDRRIAIGKLWGLGILHWKLEGVQKDLYNLFTNAKSKTIVWSCARRLGKSYALCCIAIEKCLKKPNCVVKFIAPTQKHVKMIILPLMKEILRDCPKELRPDFRTGDNMFRFQNGSEIQLAGTDAGHAETLRGGSSDLCIVDEAGFCDDLRYIIQSILIPTTTTTRGKIILSSTPPKLIDHEFVKYMEDAERKGNFVKKTIYDGLGTRITMDMVQEIIDELGGESSPEFRREYKCELIRNEELSVIPEWDDDLEKEIVKEWERPPFFDIYVGGDIGSKDLTVFLFGYYDFRAGKMIIEDEIVMNGRKMTTDALAMAIKEKEKFLYTHPETDEVQKPYIRVCDNDLILINDLHRLHNLDFIATPKDDAIAALNEMRILIKQKRMIIHPRCKVLISHLKYATWAKNKQTFSRSVEHGHYDAVDALKYMCRSILQSKNPYPMNYGMGSGDTWWSGYAPKVKEGYSKPSIQGVDQLANIFKIRRSLRHKS